tara:strand:- start:1005 stop:1511 length:507 start_codon:yes stop_codon:yes gene_type:complete
MADEQNITEENQEALEKGDENILLWATLGISFGIDIFVTELEREVALLRASGIGEAEISGILGRDLKSNGRIFGAFRNTIKRGIVSTIMQASRQGQDSVYGDRVDFAWISVGSPRICVDCEGRIGEVDTWENWERRGLPASGFSVCKERCYCQLIPTDIEMDETVIVD